MRTTVQLRRLLLALSAVLIAGLALSVVVWQWRRRFDDARAELLGLTAEVRLGMQQADVDDAFARIPHRFIKRQRASEQLTVFLTPLEFGATNWTLVVMFRGGVVVGVGVRTEVTIRRRPAGAPDDRVATGFDRDWREFLNK